MGNDDAGWQNKLISSEVQRDSRNTQYPSLISSESGGL